MQKYINLDLLVFFPSINFGRVRSYFIKNNYFEINDDIATILAQLTCYKGTLPQGASTSPLIANMICNIMDIRILKIAKKYRRVCYSTKKSCQILFFITVSNSFDGLSDGE